MTRSEHAVAIVGAGPAGLAAALALRQAGHPVVCAGPLPHPDTPDRRTTALLEGSAQFLRRLGVWKRIEPLAAPLRSLRLIDRTGRLIRAPDMLFDAAEAGAEAFGYNIPNADLHPILLDALGADVLPTSGITAIRRTDGHSQLDLDEGRSLSARLVVGADGRQSFCRESAAIGVQRWAYDQTALVCNFRHARPHHGACTEFHYASGPFTIVPLPGNASSLVWVDRPERAAALAALSNAAFIAELTARLEGLLGDILEAGPRGAFPLSGLIARTLTAHRLALVGEAGHVMPPIGAQGLNLGFRDAADLADCAAGAGDPGAASVLAAYDDRRRRDVLVRTAAADLLNRTLISKSPLLQVARGAGLMALSLAGPLRRLAMRQGMTAA
jgi:2-octaprenyl-6-methoxyphenol hydroxylase